MVFASRRISSGVRPTAPTVPRILSSMPDLIRVACVQLTSRQDKAENLAKAERLVARAASTGADLVVLPEKWNLIGRADDYGEAAEPLEGGESVESMRRWARTYGITLVGGS